MIKKRLVALGLVGAITVSGCLVGCGQKDKVSNPQDVTSSTTPQAEVEEETTEPTNETNSINDEETTEPTDETDTTEPTDETNNINEDETTETTDATDATAPIEGDTVADKLIEEFRAETKTTTDVLSIAETIGKSSVFNEIEMVAVEVEEGDLNGFDEPIEGFSKGAMFSPMISTIPFIGYIFESENAEELARTLEEKGNLNWNICTSAEDKKVVVEGDKVIFIMSPYELEDKK